MKYLNYCLFLFTVFIYSPGFAQEIPNPSFENWNQGLPVDWWGTAIFQVSDAFDGDSAVSMQVLDDGSDGVIIPILSVGDMGAGTNVSQRYSSFRGYYQVSPNVNEWFKAAIIMYNNVPIGGGAALFPATSPSTWTEFNVPITYTTGDTPDHAIIEIGVSNHSGTGVVGSHAVVDNVMFDPPSGIEQVRGLPEDYSLKQNYPNPFNSATTIEFAIAKPEFVTLRVFNILGEEVAVLVSEQLAPGSYRYQWDGAQQPSGVYYYRIQAGSFFDFRKMVLMVNK